MNKVFPIITACFILVLSLIPWGLAMAAPGIVVHPSAIVDGDEIRLGDVARIEAQGLARQMLEEISLGRSPKPGRVKTISKRQFLSSLRFQQDLIDGLGVEIPDRVFIKRNSQTISEEDIRSYLKGYLNHHFNDKEVSLERLAVPESGPYPVGEVSMAAPDSPRITRDGRFTLGLDVFVDGHKEDRIRLSGRVAVYDDVLVAVRKLSRGASLLREDGTLVRQNIFALGKESASDPESLNGKRLTRDVEKGEAILSEWLKPIPLIHKGDVITLVAQKDSIMIQTSGVSKEDGFKDSLIEVENIRSGKVVRGLVRKPSTVEVIY